ncbi:HET domain protein [Aspergillus terreus]|uniref:HET domain protein n=1 Tax=Aspergillus terreus TaxID=33178 RepID=A0A5M3YLF8_ASPTE|nr:hypothetical protein ATETN484_0001035800 [Aspergillus terreus]GFF12214.1 HET domain protein [Aspergillus terreus]
MRLLKTATCEVTEAKDIPSPFPHYAILSHTWISPRDEITYQDTRTRMADIKDDLFKQKGWSKIKSFCTRAKADGWEWAWMDTCCIDKTSTGDTQEAINAMFRWYQDAGVCYAYLPDVDAGGLEAIGGHSDPSGPHYARLKESFIKANWFTRGWTLQELLAPHYLMFVDRHWHHIGTRESWALEIKEACNIDSRHLVDFKPTEPTSCSIAMKLSWASRRETTVEEDEAYSLLGLFGISLPLIYGEGRSRAFSRFQRELILTYNDDSIFAWKAERPSAEQLPHLNWTGLLPLQKNIWLFIIDPHLQNQIPDRGSLHAQ